jgi:hypothetical protein
MAAAAYKTGGTDDTGVATLLSAKDLSTMLDQMSVTTAISQNRSSQLAQVLASPNASSSLRARPSRPSPRSRRPGRR